MSGSASMMITEEPASRATMAAGMPAAPEPITTTSTSRSQRVGSPCACAVAIFGDARLPAAAAAPATAPVLIRSRREILSFCAISPLPGLKSERRVFFFRQRSEGRAVEGVVVFLADHFFQRLHPVGPIGQFSHPRHGERAGVLDAYDRLQALAPVVRDHAIALDEMELIGVRCAE